MAEQIEHPKGGEFVPPLRSEYFRTIHPALAEIESVLKNDDSIERDVDMSIPGWRDVEGIPMDPDLLQWISEKGTPVLAESEIEWCGPVPTAWHGPRPAGSSRRRSRPLLSSAACRASPGALTR